MFRFMALICISSSKSVLQGAIKTSRAQVFFSGLTHKARHLSIHIHVSPWMEPCQHPVGVYLITKLLLAPARLPCSRK